MAHQKPSKEELKKNLNSFISQLDAPEKTSQEDKAQENQKTSPDEKVKEEVKNEDTEKKPKVEEKEQEEKIEQKEGEEEKKENVEEKKEEKEEVDYKKKFIESSREALILHSRNKQMREAIEKATKLPEPSDEEMAKLYEDWDLMTDTERKIVKDNYLAKKRLDALYEVITAGRDTEEWVEKVEKFATDPKVLNDYPELEGKTDEFIEFSAKPTRKGLPFEDLVAAFLYHSSKANPPKKGKMFETGTSGSNEKYQPSSGKISIDEARELMKRDYKKYKELLLAGKIQTDIE
jgi:hypothetical protein